MTRVNVALAAVALVPTEPDQLRLMTYRPDGRLPTAPLSVGERPEDVARRLLPDRVSAPWGSSNVPRVERVAFLEQESGLTLLFTAAVPLSEQGQEPAQTSDDWVLVTPWVGRGAERGRERMSTDGRFVRNYWRRQFEQTTAALDFLPQFFTTAQVRAAYSSLWGEQQHVGSFHRWLHDREPPAKTPIVERVEDDAVRQASEHAFAKALVQAGFASRAKVAEGALAKMAGGRAPAGVSAGLVAGSALGFVPAAVLAGGIVGSVVAYQRRTSRGKQPLWYTRCDKRRMLIDDPYAPRPRWLPTGDEPDEFH